jgi:hypothetical protein
VEPFLVTKRGADALPVLQSAAADFRPAEDDRELPLHAAANARCIGVITDDAMVEIKVLYAAASTFDTVTFTRYPREPRMRIRRSLETLSSLSFRMAVILVRDVPARPAISA